MQGCSQGGMEASRRGVSRQGRGCKRFSHGGREARLWGSTRQGGGCRGVNREGGRPVSGEFLDRGKDAGVFTWKEGGQSLGRC
jgi:hypothetical protein